MSLVPAPGPITVTPPVDEIDCTTGVVAPTTPNVWPPPADAWMPNALSVNA
jgi:hypothetical protein